MDLKDIIIKNEIKGKYKIGNKEYLARIGITFNKRDIKLLIAVYDDVENNKIESIFTREIEELREEIICKIVKDEKLNEQIEYLKKIMPEAKELFKIIKAIKLGNYLLDGLFKEKNLEIELSKSDFYYWVYYNIYFGTFNKETFEAIISIGTYIILELNKDTLNKIAHNYIKKGLSIDPYFQIFA
jgi:hypothetical protein